MQESIRITAAAVDYIESCLYERPDLETAARALHYSKYHLHHIFTDIAGLTIHQYIQRRRLTEAARMLVFSDQPILEIALSAGYESQQAFTDSFRAMYKKPPRRYRTERKFYPLQLRFVPNPCPAFLAGNEWREKIAFAVRGDIPGWLNLVRLSIDGFPHLDEAEHLERLSECIQNRCALILKDGKTVIGGMAFERETGEIHFLAVHPQYRKEGIERAFCEKLLHGLTAAPEISVTTFRSGDRADTGHRKALQNMGFMEDRLLVEFGYPTQRLVLRREAGDGDV